MQPALDRALDPASVGRCRYWRPTRTQRKAFFANITTTGAIKVEVPASTATWVTLAAIQADIPRASAVFKDSATPVAKDIAKQLKSVPPLGAK